MKFKFPWASLVLGVFLSAVGLIFFLTDLPLNNPDTNWVVFEGADRIFEGFLVIAICTTVAFVAEMNVRNRMKSE